MQMAICNVKQCDFVVWSPKGIVVESLQFDKVFWEEAVAHLLTVYKTIFVPEYFEMRVPRKLVPFFS